MLSAKTKPSTWASKYYAEYEHLRHHHGSDYAIKCLWTGHPELTNLSSETIRRGFRLYAATLKGGEIGPTPASMPPPVEVSGLPPVISGEISIPYRDGHVWCDCHIPMHNEELIRLSVTRAAMNPGQNLYIAGDFLDMDWASKYVGWGMKGPRETLREFGVARQIMEYALHVFDNIYIIPGNHDGARFKNMSKGALGFEALMTMVLGMDEHFRDGTIVLGEQRHITLKDSPWGDWRITHPDKARAVPLSLAQAISQAKHCNVLVAHQHFLGASFDRWGKHIICDGGYMAQERLMDYKVECDGTHSAWSPGYIELVGGMPNIVAIPGQRSMFGGYR